MMLTASPSRSDARAQLLPGLSLRVGDVLGGRFRLESLVSAEHALVRFSAEMAAKHTKVDVLVLFGSEALDDGVRLKFLAEARKAAVLASPHTARVLHVGVTSDGHPFMIRERLPASTLAEVLADGRCLPNEQAVDIALDVCDALLEAHALEVTHGELATHAVHLVMEGDEATSVKLAGLATERVLASLPLDATRLGLPVMRAPELLADRSASATPRADVWGVGVLLYTMLAGAPPFMAETPSAVSVSITSEEQASLAGVPDALADLVDACLSKDPSRRPASIRDVADRLLPFATKPDASLARLVARTTKPSTSVRTSPAPSPESLAVTAPVPALQGAPVPSAAPTARAIPAAAKTAEIDFDIPTPITDIGIGIETGKYKALELERLRTEVAKPAESELEISIDVGSVRDLGSVRDMGDAVAEAKPLLPPVKAPPRPEAKAKPAPETLRKTAVMAAIAAPAVATKAEDDSKAEDEHKTVTASAPPVAISVAPPPVEKKSAAKPAAAKPVSGTLAPSTNRGLRIGGVMAAAACLAAGIALGVVSPRSHKDAGTAQVGNEVSAPTPLMTATLEIPKAAAAAEAKPAETPLASFAPAAEPAKPAAEPAKPAAKAAAKPAAAKPAAVAAKPAAKPTTPAARTATQPDTSKAHDDDLRRFLDDRR